MYEVCTLWCESKEKERRKEIWLRYCSSRTNEVEGLIDACLNVVASSYLRYSPRITSTTPGLRWCLTLVMDGNTKITSLLSPRRWLLSRHLQKILLFVPVPLLPSEYPLDPTLLSEEIQSLWPLVTKAFCYSSFVSLLFFFFQKKFWGTSCRLHRLDSDHDGQGY